MIHTWSLASTDTPMVFPNIQWLGSGLGHMGSTSKRGASTPEAYALRPSTLEPTPSTTMVATKALPINRFRFIWSSTFGISATIHDPPSGCKLPYEVGFHAKKNPGCDHDGAGGFARRPGSRHSQ